MVLLAVSIQAAAAAQAPTGADRPAATNGHAPRRSPDGRLVITATETPGAIVIDGVLDEPAWGAAVPVSGFVQAEPHEGAPASDDTDVRVLVDRKNLYIGALCRDRSDGMGVISRIREDFDDSDQDAFEVVIDTFADRQNGFIFMTNRAGARSDRQMTNEGRETNASWDAVWYVRTRQTAEGWVVEMAIPFHSLRFEPGQAPYWGINFSRRIRRANEVDFWSPVPRAYNLTRVSLAGNLDGLPSVSAGRNLQVKPYVLAKTVRPTGRATTFDPSANAGVDVKYGVTPSLTLDLTGRPDFAQVEADELSVNLTQFSTFYPEKREFFIENSGIFYVGDAARSNSVSVTPTPDEDLLLFHSRRIGLSADGTPLDVYGGARLTGHSGSYELGVLTMQVAGSDHTPNTNYTVLRARRSLRPGSNIGAIFLTRQSTDDSGDYNRVYGVDANLRFGRTDWNSYLVKTATPGRTDGQYAVRTSLNRESNFVHVKAGYMALGEGFQDDLGYYRRTGAQKWLTDVGIRPRPQVLQRHGIRELHPHAVWNYYTDMSGRMLGKKLHTGFTFFFNDGGYVELSTAPSSDVLTQPLKPSPKAGWVPAGSYSWTEYQVRYNTDPSQMVSLASTVLVGGLWSGSQRTVSLSVVVRPSYRLSLTVGGTRTAADLGLPNSDFVSAIWTTRVNYSFTTNMFLDSLIQYDQDRGRLNANVRFNFIHHPLSDLFVVYNDQQILNSPDVRPGRSIIVKVTRMVAF
jgi:hypothetical protein